MYNYRLTDINGRQLGIISLETEELPELVMSGINILLSGSYVDPNPKTLLGGIREKQLNEGRDEKRKFLSFRVCPQPATEAQPARRFRRVITKRIDRVE